MQRVTALNYRKFRLRKLNTPEYKHLKYLAYWPAFSLFFVIVERLWIRDYKPVSCALDNFIPFCEYFLVFYLFWFVFLIGIQIYTLLYDVESFKKMMEFVMISYSAAIIIYILFPNCQELRPEQFERDNIFTHLVSWLYQIDTNTNVSPSVHVIGSAAGLLCMWNCKRFSTPGWRTTFSLTAFLISISTVFLKQHSIIDVVTAIPICVITGWIVYGKKLKLR